MKVKIVVILLLVVFITFYYGGKIYEYYSPAKERQIYMTTKLHNDTLDIVPDVCGIIS